MTKDKFSEEEIEDYIKVIKEFNINSAINQLQEKMKTITEPIKKAEIAQKIINLKKGE